MNANRITETIMTAAVAVNDRSCHHPNVKILVRIQTIETEIETGKGIESATTSGIVAVIGANVVKKKCHEVPVDWLLKN